jgi:ABC-2 type transport system permease protein
VQFVAGTPEDSVKLRSGELHGLLRRINEGHFELVVRKEPTWRGELENLLTAHVRQERLQAAGISDASLAQLLAPPALSVRYSDAGRAARGTGEKIAAAVFIGILLLTVMTSMAYLLTGITSEKQLRVTESVVSAISPQAWIDGKVLGISAYALTTTVNMAIGALVMALAARFAWDVTLPEAAVRPGVLAMLLVYCILGMLFWNSFFAAVAATIDDPNTSSRSTLMLLPTLPVAMCLAVLRDPDSVLSRTLAVLPITSAPAMPVRMVLSDPSVPELSISLTVLLAAIWVSRRLAGRIFEVGMLLYGKEPTLREILRWARSSADTRAAAGQQG